MSKKYVSLAHAIRQIHEARQGAVIHPSDKPVETAAPFIASKVDIKPPGNTKGDNDAAQTQASARVRANQALAAKDTKEEVEYVDERNDENKARKDAVVDRNKKDPVYRGFDIRNMKRPTQQPEKKTKLYGEDVEQVEEENEKIVNVNTTGIKKDIKAARPFLKKEEFAVDEAVGRDRQKDFADDPNRKMKTDTFIDKGNVQPPKSKVNKVSDLISKMRNGIRKESLEELEELSNKTYGNYIKARSNYDFAADKSPEGLKKSRNVTTGVTRAADGIVRNMDKKYGTKAEEVEVIDELSKNTLDSYATKKIQKHGFAMNAKSFQGFKLANKKLTGTAKVNATEESEPIDELSNHTLDSYQHKAASDPSRKEGRKLALKKMDGRAKVNGTGSVPFAEAANITGGFSGKFNVMQPGMQKPIDKIQKVGNLPKKPGVNPTFVKDLAAKVASEATEPPHDVDGVSKGTKERRKLNYVGRMDGKLPNKDLGRQAAYKTNVIDEERLNTIKRVLNEKDPIAADKKKDEIAMMNDSKTKTFVPRPGATPTVYRPNLNKASPDGTIISS